MCNIYLEEIREERNVIDDKFNTVAFKDTMGNLQQKENAAAHVFVS